jgi:hypothetical protein
MQFFSTSERNINIVFEIPPPKKKSITQKIHPLRTAKRRGLRIVLRINLRGFSVYSEKFGTSRSLLSRIGHDRFILHVFRLKSYEPLNCRSLLFKKIINFEN